MNRGYFRIYRCIQDNPLWQEKPFDRARAWIDLILQARYEDSYVRIRGVKVSLNRGDVGVSEVGLADRWGWSRGKVRRFLDELETEQQIVQQKNNVTSLISVVNYDLYQADGTADGTANNTADGQQTDTNKKGNKVKNIKNQLADGDARQQPVAPQKLGFDYSTGKFLNVNGQYEVWCDAYPAVDVMAELKRMAAWLVSNPKHKKTDIARFINNWLSKQQDAAVRAPAGRGQYNSQQPAAPFAPATDPTRAEAIRRTLAELEGGKC